MLRPWKFDSDLLSCFWVLGLEIVLLTSLLTFSDYSEQGRIKPEKKEIAEVTSPANIIPASAPTIPEKPEGWQEDQVAILQAKEQVGFAYRARV